MLQSPILDEYTGMRKCQEDEDSSRIPQPVDANQAALVEEGWGQRGAMQEGHVV